MVAILYMIEKDLSVFGDPNAISRKQQAVGLKPWCHICSLFYW